MNQSDYERYITSKIEKIDLSSGIPIPITSYTRNSFNLADGTIIIKFKNFPKQGYLPLVSFVNRTHPSSYLSVYIAHAQRIGVLKKYVSNNFHEERKLDIYSSVIIDPGLTHTMALSCCSQKGYSLFLNGKTILNYKDESAALFCDLNDASKIDMAVLGGFFDSQKIPDRYYNFTGYIDFMYIYSKAIDTDYLKMITGKTAYEDSFIYCDRKKGLDVFYPGLDNCSYYRIPALIKTKKGTYICSIDKRANGPQDHSNTISTIIRRSTDGGKAFEKPVEACSMYGRGQTIDSSLLQDESAGRIFLLNNSHPETISFFKSTDEPVNTKIGKATYLTLVGRKGRMYGTDKGEILDGNLKTTDFNFDEKFNLFDKDVLAGNLFNCDSPVRVPETTFTLLTYSDDDGNTWSEPKILNSMIKKPFMHLLNVSPGIGIQLKNGSHSGRLCFPVYFSNKNNALSSALIYSDDHGETFHIGASPNDGRIFNGKKVSSQDISDKSEYLTECQAVEMPNGYIKLFMRNMNSRIAISTSRDGGETFGEVVYDDNLPDPYCQCSVVALNKRIDGKNAIAFCNPASAARINGTIRIGLLDYNGATDDYDIKWKYNKLIKRGSFAYSCMFPDEDSIGVLYEGTPSTYITFEKIPLSYILS